MAITPWPKGNLVPAWVISLIPDTGAFSVTGLVVGNFSLRILNNNAGSETIGGGTFSNITAAVMNGSVVVTPASVTYQPVAADVGTLGMFTLWLDVTFAAGVQSFNLGLWQVVTE
jgi:hypothetical protein